MPFKMPCLMQPFKRYGIALFLMGAQHSFAATCSVTTTPVNFGSYDVFASQPTDTIGSVSINCNPETTAYSISLEKGIQGSINNRRMASATTKQKLYYNLYTDGSYSTIWGNGQANTVKVSGISSKSYNVYGRIQQGQNVNVGSYTDSVTVTVSF